MTTLRTRPAYENTLTAIGLCVSARIPVLLWGNPGEGKTSMIESATACGWHVETVIISQSEPSDLAGLPVVGRDGSVVLAPPRWAQRLADTDGPALCFFDEFSTAQPSLQAAALRVLTHGEVGSLRLPDAVAFVAAANPVDVAAAGWELAAPTASRFVHLDINMPLDVFNEGAVTGHWPQLPVFATPDEFPALRAKEMATVAGFLRARETQLSVIPKDSAGRGRAFPTPRTWTFAGTLVALASAIGANDEVVEVLVAGCIGDSAAYEYLAWRGNLDLPDPDDLLENRVSAEFTGLRPDRVYVLLQSLLAALRTNPSAERWSTAIKICSAAAEQVGTDPAVPTLRALMREENRPQGAAAPAEIAIFAPVLALAGLLPGEVR